MRLKKEIIERINGNEEAKPVLMGALKKSRQLISRMVRQNRNNGPLTTLTALTALSILFKIADPYEMVEEVPVEETVEVEE